MKISLNKDKSFDLDKLMVSKLLVQANSGGGKSWAIRRLIEQSHGKVQHIVIDLEGEFLTLREKYDFLLAGKGGDVDVSVKTAKLLAQKVLELGVSTIVDISDMHAHERKPFVKLFCESLLAVPKENHGDCMVIVDEAHQFAPEKGQSEAAAAIIDLCTRGRKRYLCVVLATQRISKLAKDAAAECNNKLIGRSAQDVDMKRAADELGFSGRDQILSLRHLEPGEFYVFGPAISHEVQKIKIGPVETTHERRRGLDRKPIAPTAKIKAVLSKLADLPQEAQKEAETIKDLKEQIRILKRNPFQVKEKLVRDESYENILIKRALDKQSAEYSKEIGKYTRVIQDIQKKISPLLIDGFPVYSAPKMAIQFNEAQNNPIKIPREKIIKISDGRINLTIPDENVSLTTPERKILNALAWLLSIGVSDPEQSAVAFLAGYTVGGGAFNNPKGKLRSRGLIEYKGDRLSITEAGEMLAETPDVTLNTETLHEKVLSILPTPEQRILKPLLETYPNSMTGEDLAQASNYEMGGGAFNNPKGRLRSLGLIEYLPDKTIKAKSLLFLE